MNNVRVARYAKRLKLTIEMMGSYINRLCGYNTTERDNIFIVEQH